MLTLVALSLYAGVSFEHLTNAGERWNNGIWYKLDDAGHIVGPELQPGDPGAVLIGTRQDPPDLLRLSATTVVVSVNDTTMASTDGGRSWAHLTKSSGPCTKPSVPAPSWLDGKLWMEVNPVAACPRCRSRTRARFAPNCATNPRLSEGPTFGSRPTQTATPPAST